MNDPQPDLLAEVDALLDLVADYRDAEPELLEQAAVLAQKRDLLEQHRGS